MDGFWRFVGELQCEIGAGMKEKTFMDRVVMLLGFLVGVLIWFWGVVFSLIRTLWQTISGESVSDTRTQTTSGADDAHSGFAGATTPSTPEGDVSLGEEQDDTEPFAIEPDPTAGEDTVVPGLGVSHLDSTYRQHGELGGIPEDQDSGQPATPADTGSSAPQGLSAASDFSYAGTPYDADLTEDGTPLNYQDETDRQGDVPLDEGIPNLGEPGDVEDTGPELASEEVAVEDVEDDVPEDYGSGDELDSVENDEPWEAESPEDDDIPAASRGYREYGEEDTDEDDDDYTADDELEYEASGTGGEVDLENDEAPAWDSADFSIVDDPDEPLSADELDTPLDVSAGDEDALESGPGHLGVSGDFEQVDETERHPGVIADQGAGVMSASDTDAEAFPAEDSDSLETGAEPDNAIPAGEFGDTGDFGAPDDVVASTEELLDEVGTSQRDEGETSVETDDQQHLGVSGTFDEADETVAMPGQVTDDASSSESGEHSSSGYSAAWSTPAGVLGEWPNQAEGATGPDTNAGQDDSPGTPVGDYPAQDLSGGDEADLAAAGAGDLGAVTTGDSRVQESASTVPDTASRTHSGGGDIPSGAIAGDGTASCPAAYPIKGNASSHIYHRPTDSSYAATIPEYCFATEEDAAAAGYRPPRGHGRTRKEPAPSGTVTDDVHADADVGVAGVADGDASDGVISQETYRVASGNGDADTGVEEASGNVPRKSRKQRKAEQSDWLPAGAVRGDGTGICPVEYPIKGNASSRIYHRPTDHSYGPTIPEFCFATEDDARKAGFRAPKG